MRRIEPVKRLDVPYGGYSKALFFGATGSENQRENVEREIERSWGVQGALSCLSVRTGFDAYLTALRLPKESVVLMSGITIPDMATIVRGHALEIKAIDVDFDTLGPKLKDFRSMFEKYGERVKMIVISHVFGALAEIEEILRWARKNNILFVEDCAEAFAGPRAYRGSAEADFSAVSFGTIKTATALGGAVVCIRDEMVRENVRDILRGYAVQSTATWVGRVAKYSAFSRVLNHQRVYGIFVDGVNALGKDHMDVLLANSRGFINQDLFQGIRLQPCVGLLLFLQWRLDTFDEARVKRRTERCRLAADLIEQLPGVDVPGKAVRTHLYWLFPVVVENPARVARGMLSRGYDATAGTSSLISIGPDTCPQANALFSKLLYLPVDADTSKQTVRDMISALGHSVGNSKL